MAFHRGPEDLARYAILVSNTDDGSVGSHRFLLGVRGIGSVVFIGEADVVTLDVEQPVIGDRDAVGVNTLGALLDAGVGAMIGRSIDRNNVTCR
jgi:hypothetical protein